ncbi:MAG: substrate-binding domain-containing protein [Planctomycetes bacterium]|nr:substrate-binding domain-containing protein [Planctomycetota bacterium]
MKHAPTKNVAVVLGEGVTSTDNYFSPVLQGIEEVVSANKYTLSLIAFEEDLFNMIEFYEKIESNRFTGVMIIGQIPDEVIKHLQTSLHALTIVDSIPPSSDIDCIACDNEQGAYDAVSHLINLGHKRIAMIRGPLENYFSRGIYNGYCQALEKYEIRYDESLIAEGNFHPDGGYNAMKQILQLPVLPTALFSNDEMSIGAMKAIKEKGLRIPEDIAIVGFDDISLSSHVHPSLTTICVPKKNLGRLAAKKLFECLEDPEHHQHTKTVIPIELVIRESCGANLRE